MFIAVFLCVNGDLFASWYGCAEYAQHELEKMTEDDLREAYVKNARLTEEIYEDAAVQSIMDKRLYHFRTQQYLDCLKYTEAIDRLIKERFPE